MQRLLNPAMLLYARQQQKRFDQIDLYQSQMQVFGQLLQWSLGSRFARDHDLHRQMSWSDFQAQVPLRDYDDYRLNYLEPNLQNLDRILTNLPVCWIGKTSGTSAGREKQIPITALFMEQNRQASQLQALFNLLAVKDARALLKPIFWLTDMSDIECSGPYPMATTARLMRSFGPPALNRRLLPRTHLFEHQPPSERFEQLIRQACDWDVWFVAGVSPWLLTLFKRMIEFKQVENIQAIWPHLKLVGHAGVCFDWYADSMRHLVGPGPIFRESYAGTEGYYGFQALCSTALRLIPHLGLLYECIKVEDYQQTHPRRYGLWEVETEQTYVLYVSNSCGLWSYEVGDLICFEQTRPTLLCRVVGRVQAKFDFLGDKLLLREIETVLQALQKEHNLKINDYHVGIDMPARQMHLLLDCEQAPASLLGFMQVFDQRLQACNDQYRRNRQGAVNQQPRAELVAAGGFQLWLEQTRQTHLQTKIPHLFSEPSLFSEFYQSLVDLDLILPERC